MTTPRRPTKASSQHRWIPVSEISVVYHETQRGALTERNVRRIVDQYDPDAIGTLTVAKLNGDPMWHCIDGAHRLEALRRIFGDDADLRVPCEVKAQAETTADLARMFVGINTFERPNAIVRFLRRTQFDPVAADISDIAAAAGWEVSTTCGDGTIQCVARLEQIYTGFGADHLADVLDVAAKSWGNTDDAAASMILAGLDRVLRAEGCDRERLIHQLQARTTPALVLGQAKALKELRGGQMPKNVADVIATAYNFRLKANQITP